MKSPLLLAAIFAAAPSARAAAVAPPPAPVAHALQEDFVRVSESAKPAVVNIATVQEQEFRVVNPYFFFGEPEDLGGGRTFKQRTEGVGSGFIIDDQGHVLTNDHVVRDATEIRVTLTHPGGKDEILPGKVVGHDANLDIAVVQIHAKRAFPF
ncbi:MAG TPA: trypsin-like peptidase domain-containing protein, partial [Elusimicrobiota bacterium]|nr:trypsin-like peptidase domain-containing protein [Elusimicrobiota bacterium]